MFVEDLWKNGARCKDIIAALEEKGVKTRYNRALFSGTKSSARGLKHTLKRWNLKRCTLIKELPEAILTEIQSHFWASESDEEISEHIKASMGLDLTSATFRCILTFRKRQIVHIRNQKGLKRSTNMTDEQLDKLILAQKETLNGKLEVRPMVKHLRTFCRVWCNRDRVMKRLRVVDPEGRKSKPPDRATRRLDESSDQGTEADADVSESAREDTVLQEPAMIGEEQPNFLPTFDSSPNQHPPIGVFYSSIQHDDNHNSHHQQIDRLSADNEYLRMQAARVMDEIAILRAEIARLTQAANSHSIQI
jgi:hypothetical protein